MRARVETVLADKKSMQRNPFDYITVGDEVETVLAAEGSMQLAQLMQLAHNSIATTCGHRCNKVV